MKHKWRLVAICMLVLQAASACDNLLGVRPEPTQSVAVFPRDQEPDEGAGVPTAVAEAIVSAADAEYRLLTNIYERVSPSVVNVESASFDEAGTVNDTRRGSGFIYDQDGHIVTNAHLVKDADALSVTLPPAQVLEARLLGWDSFSDLAVLKIEIDADRLAPLLIGESGALRVGQRAISIGSPFGLDNSMTAGIVSGLDRTLRSAEMIDGDRMPGYDNPAIIQIDTPINPGTSGGPLLDSQGYVIGITTAIRSDNGVFQGVGFAVPADTLRRVVPDLIRYGRVDYAWMGLSVMREEGGFGVAGLRQALDLAVERGVLLSGVAEGSPADLAGLRGGREMLEIRGKQICAGGDIIVAIDDHYMANLDELNAYLIQKTRPGDDVIVLVIRDKRAFQAKLTLQPRPVAGERRVLDCNADS